MIVNQRNAHLSMKETQIRMILDQNYQSHNRIRILTLMEEIILMIVEMKMRMRIRIRIKRKTVKIRRAIQMIRKMKKMKMTKKKNMKKKNQIVFKIMIPRIIPPM